jgi:23S rRNA (uracil1939-C5)-methyltransferase
MIIRVEKELEETELELKVSFIDNQGNGVSFSNNIVFLIPGALKDEVVLAKPMKTINKNVYCKLTKVKLPSVSRIKEDCNKFIICGGCNFRQVNNAWLQNWKLEKLIQKTDSLKIQKKILPMTTSKTNSRRRATFSANYQNGRFNLGFISKFDEQIIDLQVCKILEEDLLQLYRHLKDNLKRSIKKNINFKIQINLVHNGSDIVFDIKKGSYKKIFEIDNLISGFISMNVLRVSFREGNKTFSYPLNGEVRNKLGILNNKTIFTFPPPGGFLQPTKSGENEIIKYVLSAIKGSKRVADLFCGSGTLSIPISENAEMICVDSNIDSLLGLKSGLKFYNKIDKNEVFHQNLLRLPISSDVLKKLDSIVINPPSKGAIEQIKEIIKSCVKIIVYVSCNINSFERDALILLKNGYEMEWLKPIDQFPNTNHLEIVSKFNMVNKQKTSKDK